MPTPRGRLVWSVYSTCRLADSPTWPKSSGRPVAKSHGGAPQATSAIFAFPPARTSAIILPVRAAHRRACRRTPPPSNPEPNRSLSASRRLFRILRKFVERHVQERTRVKRADLFPCFRQGLLRSLEQGHGKRPLFVLVSFRLARAGERKENDDNHLPALPQNFPQIHFVEKVHRCCPLGSRVRPRVR